MQTKIMNKWLLVCITNNSGGMAFNTKVVAFKWHRNDINLTDLYI